MPQHKLDPEAFLLPAVVAVLALALWQTLHAVTHATAFPSPAAVARGIGELAGRGILAGYTWDSMRRVGGGYLLALVLGIPLGLLMGWSEGWAAALNPVVQFLRPISPLAWIPVSIVLFGVSDLAAIFLIFLSSLFPIAVATMNGVRGVPQVYLRAGRNFGLSTPTLLSQVVLPAALPQILIGLRIALGVSWLVVVAAEMIAVDSGLGYLVIDSRNAGKRYDLVVGAILIIGVIGLLLDLLARRVERLPRVRWGFERA